MRLSITLLFALTLALGSILTTRASLLTVFITNSVTGLGDTNFVYVIPLNDNNPVLSDGSIVTKGIATRAYPDTNGLLTIWRGTGFYAITNKSIALVYRFNDMSSNSTAYIQSGWNTYGPAVVNISTGGSSVTNIPDAGGVTTGNITNQSFSATGDTAIKTNAQAAINAALATNNPAVLATAQTYADSAARDATNEASAYTIKTNQTGIIFYLSDFGAKPDGLEFHDATILNGSDVITCPSANFTSSDVGKTIWTYLDNTNLTDLLTTIASVQSATQATMAVNSTVSITGTNTFVYGTDNTAQFQMAYDFSHGLGGGQIVGQSGIYVLAGNCVNRNSGAAQNESSVVTLRSVFIRQSPTNKITTTTLEGPIPGAHGVSVDTNYPSLSGMIVFCPTRPTLANSATNFNCIFGANCNATNYALEQYWFKNLTIRKIRGTQLHGIAAPWGGGLCVLDSGFDVDYNFGDQENPPNYIPRYIPTNTIQNQYTDTAIWTPGTDNDSNTKITRVYTYGWGCGIEAGEHSAVDDCEFEYGGTGMSLFTSLPTYGANHNSNGLSGHNIHLMGNTIQLAAYTNSFSLNYSFEGLSFENHANTTTELYDNTGGTMRGFFTYVDSYPLDVNNKNYTSTNASWFFRGSPNAIPKWHFAPGINADELTGTIPDAALSSAVTKLATNVVADVTVIGAQSSSFMTNASGVHATFRLFTNAVINMNGGTNFAILLSTNASGWVTITPTLTNLPSSIVKSNNIDQTQITLYPEGTVPTNGGPASFSVVTSGTNRSSEYDDFDGNIWYNATTEMLIDKSQPGNAISLLYRKLYDNSASESEDFNARTLTGNWSDSGNFTATTFIDSKGTLPFSTNILVSVNNGKGSVNGGALTNLNASALSSGIVGAARLGTGTADSTTYLRGDGTWNTPSGNTVSTLLTVGWGSASINAGHNFVGVGANVANYSQKAAFCFSPGTVTNLTFNQYATQPFGVGSNYLAKVFNNGVFTGMVATNFGSASAVLLQSKNSTGSFYYAGGTNIITVDVITETELASVTPNIAVNIILEISR